MLKLKNQRKSFNLVSNTMPTVTSHHTGKHLAFYLIPNNLVHVQS